MTKYPTNLSDSQWQIIPKRKVREKENIKKSILKATLDIAVKEGWQAVTIRKVSEAIEYTTSIVYSHYESKEALLNEITSYGFGMLYSKFEKASADETEPEKQLIKLGLANWDFALRNKELYQLMFSIGKPLSTNINVSKGKALINDVFRRLNHKSEEENESLVLNYICLRQGAIFYLMNGSDNVISSRGRKLFTEFIERFIESIRLAER